MLFPENLYQRYKKSSRNKKRHVFGIIKQTIYNDEDILKVQITAKDLERIKVVLREGKELEKVWNYGAPMRIFRRIKHLHSRGKSAVEISNKLKYSLRIVQNIISHL